MYHLFHRHLRRSGIEAVLLQGVLWVIVVQCMYVVKAKIPRGHLGGGGAAVPIPLLLCLIGFFTPVKM